MPPTVRQELGSWGEELVRKSTPCLRCKRKRSLRRLPTNFKCADIICDFCGYLAQVKTTDVADVDQLPKTLLGAAWAPQYERMQAGIYFPLFIVLTTRDHRQKSIFYLPADLQGPEVFVKRKPLSATARRAGWQGYMIRLGADGSYTPARIL